MALPLHSLESRISQALELIPPPHRLPPQDEELFATLEEGKKRLQDYVFTQGFALASSSFQKGKTVQVLDCTWHKKKTRNHRKIADEDRVRVGNKVLFEDCKYRLRLRLKERRWQLVVTNDQHSHELAIDPFSLWQHQWRDPGRLNALSQAQSLRAAGIKYRQALRALNIQGLRLSKDDYYNLSRSEGAHTVEEARQFALGVLKKQGFQCKMFWKNHFRKKPSSTSGDRAFLLL